ncbi:MAG: DoxX family protein [Alphaproteobacteria bacterium]|nr:DoxX family protein [Alphaproteobacteria bacterium]MBV9694880.1 DoxX family protein [Alphaproteobacteria bacterium]
MQEDLGKLVLRVMVAGLIMAHGVHKLLTGISGIEAMLAAHNLPAMLGYGVYLGEIVAPAMVLLGLFARVGALLIAVNMIVAVALAGMDRIAMLNPMGGYALELEAAFLLGAIAIALMGPGRISIAGGRWN